MEKLLNIDQVVEILGIKKSTLYAWVHRGTISHVKLGGLIKFREQDIDGFINERVRAANNRRGRW